MDNKSGYKKAPFLVRALCFMFGHVYDDYDRLLNGNRCVFCNKENPDGKKVF